MPGISWDWRTEPVSGKPTGMEDCVDMPGHSMRSVDMAWSMGLQDEDQFD